ncbi:MAG: RagB/SusD family nutrient uptake outer membrane protein [Muribaculaceae bacterium]|nr:RagB/SusD family nutrient uptake outer membrane protein [Muribaculaceae bacterium]
MKTLYKAIAAATLLTPLFTGCIEEAIPTSSVIQSQLEGNPAATEALVWGMPGRMNQITLDADTHCDFGYPAIMHMRDVMTEDMSVRYAGGYDWFSGWSANLATGPNKLFTQIVWNYFYEQILTSNKTISAIDINTDSPELRSYLGAGYAYRAFIYLDMARMYEVLPNDLFPDCMSPDGNDIKGLTVPIVTEETTEEQSRNNPRASHSEIFNFIKGDLETAVSLLSTNAAARVSKTIPNLPVVYGLMARMYLWDASYQAEINSDAALAATQYDNAAKYARLAISESGAVPLTESEWQSTTSGFNDSSFSSWLFAGQYNKEDDVVVAGGIRTFTSFCSNEQNFGYAAPEQGSFTEIGASLYERLSDRDFRKLSFVAPEGSVLKGREPFLDKEFAAANFDGPYIAIKFRPGEGNMTDYNVGAVVAYPLMRVEEMYFIEAEAKAHNNPAEGNNLLTTFMKAYRNPNYTNYVSDEDGVVEEIVFQKRIELWGEGLSFFDIKRLNMPVTRFYDGTNFDITLNTFNTNTRPAWMNFCIVQTEPNNNTGVAGYNTPSCEQAYPVISQ